MMGFTWSIHPILTMVGRPITGYTITRLWTLTTTSSYSGYQMRPTTWRSRRIREGYDYEQLQEGRRSSTLIISSPTCFQRVLCLYVNNRTIIIITSAGFGFYYYFRSYSCYSFFCRYYFPSYS